MSTMTVSIPHQLSRPDAKEKVEQLLDQVKQQYGGSIGRIDETWTDDTLDFKISVMAMSLTGQVFVEDSVVRLEVELPAALAMFAGGVKKTIEEEGRKLLNKPKNA